jgi:hypothetical protein
MPPDVEYLGSPDLSDEDVRSAAVGLNDMLADLGYSKVEITDWWNLLAFKELGGRTPTRAWLEGDHEAVRGFVANLYAASELARDHRDPVVLAELNRRLERR